MARLDDVMDALVSTFSDLPALDGVAVVDGPQVGDVGESDLVLVGHDGEPDSNAVNTFEQSWTDLACTRREETGLVWCAAVSQSGDVEMQPRRDRALALVAACEASLLADLTLGGVVYSAQLAAGSARQLQNSGGAAVVAPFTVAYRAPA